MTNFDVWDEVYMKRLVDSFNIPIISLTAPWKDMSTEKFEKIIHMGQYLGVKLITFSPPHLTDKDTKWFWEYLKNVSEKVEIPCAIQNVEAKFLFFIIPEYRNATLEKIKSVSGCTTLDLMSLDTEGGKDIMEAQAELGSSIKNIFFADKSLTQKWLIPGKMAGGLSQLPLESFLMRMKSIGYDGYISVKISPKEMGIGDASEVERNLWDILNYYKTHFLDFTLKK